MPQCKDHTRRNDPQPCHAGNGYSGKQEDRKGRSEIVEDGAAHEEKVRWNSSDQTVFTSLSYHVGKVWAIDLTCQVVYTGKVMDALALHPDGYTGTYKLIGGRISLDFVNTLAWPGTAREHDWFAHWPNIVDWSVACGILGYRDGETLKREYHGHPGAAARAIRVVRYRRQSLRDVLFPLAQGLHPERTALEMLNDLLRSTCASRELDHESLKWKYHRFKRLEDLVEPAVQDAADLISDADRSRLRCCPACHWLFYDRSRNGSRRWCDMGDCGSRAKALRYYHRQRAME